MLNLNVQIVDDDVDFAESMADLISTRGHSVAIAHSGREALAQSEKEHFDVTFMDVKMPEMDGVETFKALREFNPASRVFMMTAFTVETMIDEALGNGALGVLHKPLDILQLHKALESVNEGLFTLVVDDDADFAQSVSEILRGRGYTVGTYTSGKSALDHLLSDGVNVLVMDARLKDSSALEISSELEKAGINLPVVIITGFQEEARRITKSGISSVAGVLMKPFDPEALLEILENIEARNND